jgi:hypothetical protein
MIDKIFISRHRVISGSIKGTFYFLNTFTPIAMIAIARTATI